MKLKRRCKCGCGEITSPGRKWIYNHHRKKHGLYKHKLYRLWSNMKQRCYNKKSTRYQNWGGRGIRVCVKWRDNFKAFYNWSINNGWRKGLTIDRIDNDGNYHPDNCRFVSQKINHSNKRMRSDNKTGFVGVSFDKDTNKYRARIHIDGKYKHLGLFNTANEAVISISKATNKQEINHDRS